MAKIRVKLSEDMETLVVAYDVSSLTKGESTEYLCTYEEQEKAKVAFNALGLTNQKGAPVRLTKNLTPMTVKPPKEAKVAGVATSQVPSVDSEMFRAFVAFYQSQNPPAPNHVEEVEEVEEAEEAEEVEEEATGAKVVLEEGTFAFGEKFSFEGKVPQARTIAKLVSTTCAESTKKNAFASYCKEHKGLAKVLCNEKGQVITKVLNRCCEGYSY
jgi:hypothetical protein